MNELPEQQLTDLPEQSLLKRRRENSKLDKDINIKKRKNNKDKDTNQWECCVCLEENNKKKEYICEYCSIPLCNHCASKILSLQCDCHNLLYPYAADNGNNYEYQIKCPLCRNIKSLDIESVKDLMKLIKTDIIKNKMLVSNCREIPIMNIQTLSYISTKGELILHIMYENREWEQAGHDILFDSVI